MCGITGFFQAQKLDKTDLVSMADAIAHRGPDGDGFFYDSEAGLGLGHRRLAIIDLSDAANQPMTDPSCRYQIVYNGELYNYLEIKKELEALGEKFYTESDTEVFLRAFLKWGSTCFEKFNGMWASCIYDSLEKKIHLCRDRYGVKPLYYYYNGKELLFGSELKAILAASPKISLNIDMKSMANVFSGVGKLEASAHTLYRNVFSLQPGHFIEMDKKGLKEVKWWNTADHIHQEKIPYEEQKEKFLEILTDACRLRLRSDVPVATSLSGGLDSSAIVCLLSKMNSNKQYRTFVHIFPGDAMDESEYAKAVLAHTNTPVTWVEYEEKDLLNNIDKMVYGFESLYPGIPDAAQRIYKSQKANGFSVTLDGHGSDELLGGYNEYLYTSMADHFFRPGQLLTEFHQAQEQLGYSYKSSKVFKGIIKEMLPFKEESGVFKKLRERSVQSLGCLTADGIQIKPHAEKELEVPKHLDRLSKMLYRDFHQRILPRLLHNFDLTSMMNGVEVRMPFLDYRLVNLAFSLPAESKIGKGYSKRILRDSLEGVVPDKILQRKLKIGFHSPFSKWATSFMKPWIYETLAKSSPSDPFIDRTKVKNFYENIFLRDPKNEKLANELWLLLSSIRLFQLVQEKHKGIA